MFHTHYWPLVAAYFAALAAWSLTSRRLPWIWPAAATPAAAIPAEATPAATTARGTKQLWQEFGYAMIGVAGVLVMGQLWSRGIRLPVRGMIGPLAESINQLLIFGPVLLVPVLRRQSWTSAWLPRPRLALRLCVGAVLAAVAVGVYAALRGGADAPWVIFGRVWQYEHVGKAMQVLLEDIAIAIVFVRLANAAGSRFATVIVAVLFAAGHIPALMSEGATLTEIAGLLRDAGLGVAVIVVLQQSRDVVWFWCIHFCLDMTQFAEISGVG